MAEDFLSIMKVLPDPVGSFMQGRQDTANLQQTQLQNQTGAFQLQQAQQNVQQQQAQQAAYQQDLGGFIQNPTAEGAANLALKHPAQAKAITDAWGMRDKAVQDADRQQLANVYSLIDNGHPELAQAQLEQRQQADQAAGKSEPMVDALLQTIKADPSHAKGIAAYMLASIPGGEDFAKTLTAVGPKDGGTHVINEGGALVDDHGAVLYQAGKSPKYQTVKNADGSESIVSLPQGAPGGASVGKVPAAALAPAIVAQESGGNYTAKNPSTGALGAYQIMPATGAALAKRVGVAWNPGLMTADTPSARAYQDKIGRAALAEAVDNTDNAADAARYYHGGSDRGKWGPKTQAYAGQVVQRLSGSDQGLAATNGNVVYTSKGGDPASAPGDTTKTGDEYLATVPTDLANRARALLDGRTPYPSQAALKSPQVQQLLAAAQQADPSFDAATWFRRKKTSQDYSPGGSVGQTLNSGKTVINHLYALAQASERLGGSSWTLLNGAVNAGRAAFSNEDLAKYNETRTLVAPELAKFLTGKAPAQGEIEKHYESLDPNQGPAARKAIIAQAMDLISGRFGPLVDGYKDAMGRSFDIDHAVPGGAVSGKVQALERWANGGQLEAKAPAKLSTRAQVQALPVGAQFIWTDGKVHTRK